jgi:hypothetical protein
LTSRRQLIGQLRRPISGAAADPADNAQKKTAGVLASTAEMQGFRQQRQKNNSEQHPNNSQQ